MSYGYNGKVLHVNLSTKVLQVEKPPEQLYRTYMGGSALNLYYLLKYMLPGVDPLGPDNILAISVGITTGAPISGLSRATASAKSPLTGAIGDSQCGGFWPAKLKFAGFDSIVIRGKAVEPVYLWIHDGEAELRDASQLWGKITGDVESEIKSKLKDSDIEILQIGPAGEKMVRFASILNMCNRAMGRTGMGAVMGSKKLKAIVVKGNKKISMADPKSIKELVRLGTKIFPGSIAEAIGKYGTPGNVATHQALGGLPSFNYKSGVFDGWKRIDANTIYKTLLKGRENGKQDKEGRDTCYGCIIRCRRVAEIKMGQYEVDSRYGGPEYETLAMLGSYCGIDNLEAIAKANEICNKYGIDTMSCGATIAWAMEAFESGLLSLQDTDGLSLEFGNAQSMVKLVEMIGKREGFGDILAEGSARAAASLGRGDELLITCKGQEIPAHMPHVKRSLGLIYAVNPFGADHQSCDHDPSYEDGYEAFKKKLVYLNLTKPQPPQSLNVEKVNFARKTQHFMSMADSLNLCQFVWGPSFQLYGPEETVKMVCAVSGWNVTIDELLKVGERRLNMMRVFNAREGINRKHDKLPKRFFKRALKGGPTDGWKLDEKNYKEALNEYYRQSGWNVETGIPMRSTLKRLGLEWLIGSSMYKYEIHKE